ncbi:hypothetical protein [Sphingomonas sp. Y38-1Y]|nr:hypothetical protein [Sphingomonas sp. Y38-1Y]
MRFHPIARARSRGFFIVLVLGSFALAALSLRAAEAIANYAAAV